MSAQGVRGVHPAPRVESEPRAPGRTRLDEADHHAEQREELRRVWAASQNGRRAALGLGVNARERLPMNRLVTLCALGLMLAQGGPDRLSLAQRRGLAVPPVPAPAPVPAPSSSPAAGDPTAGQDPVEGPLIDNLMFLGVRASAGKPNRWPMANLSYSFPPDGVEWGGGKNVLNTNLEPMVPKWRPLFHAAARAWQDAGAGLSLGEKPEQGAFKMNVVGPLVGDPRFGEIRVGGYDFGKGRPQLAVTSLPPPVGLQGAPMHGDMSINIGIDWANFDFYTVAMHELGHALGLEHTSNPRDVMYARYNGRKLALTDGDVKAVRALYAVSATSLPNSPIAPIIVTSTPEPSPAPAPPTSSPSTSGTSMPGMSCRAVPFDFDGDGVADRAVFRRTTGEWFISQSFAGPRRAIVGRPRDIPVAADYDGDGLYDLATYRPGAASVWTLQSSSTGAVTETMFGGPSDVPVQADYDGDGLADLAVYRPITCEWFILRSRDGGLHVQFGGPDDIPVSYPFGTR